MLHDDNSKSIFEGIEMKQILNHQAKMKHFIASQTNYNTATKLHNMTEESSHPLLQDSQKHNNVEIKLDIYSLFLKRTTFPLNPLIFPQQHQ